MVAPSNLLRRVRLPNSFSIKFEVRGLLTGLVELHAYNVLSLVDGVGGNLLTVDAWPDGSMDISYGTDVISATGGMLPTNDPTTPDWTTLTVTVNQPDASYALAEVTLTSSTDEDPAQEGGLDLIQVSGADSYLYAARRDIAASSGEVRNIQISGKIRFPAGFTLALSV
jgi:hypothetical protein